MSPNTTREAAEELLDAFVEKKRLPDENIHQAYARVLKAEHYAVALYEIAARPDLLDNSKVRKRYVASLSEQSGDRRRDEAYNRAYCDVLGRTLECLG